MSERMPALLSHWLQWMPRWIVVSIVFALVVLGAIFVQDVATRLIRRIAMRWPPTVKRMFLQTRTVVRFAFVLLAATIALPLVPLPANANDTVRKIFAAAFVVLIGWCAVAIVEIAIDRYMSRYRLDVDDNLLARKAVTQARVLKRAINFIIILVTAGFALMTFDSVRQYGVSLFASASVAGIIIGLAAQPLLGNLLAGMQIALTQPIRINDTVCVEGEQGRVEEITSTYVVVRLWDWRRMILPLTYFLQKPFQNWSRSGGAGMIGSAKVYVDYSMHLDSLRAKLMEIVSASPLWDGNLVKLEVTDARESTLEVRAAFSARKSDAAVDLACLVREQLVAFIQEKFPQSLPRRRNENLTITAA